MNIKTEEQQLADRAVSLIKRLGMHGLSDCVVNLRYKMEPYHNKISKETDHLELNHINVKCLKQLLEFHEDVADIAYGHKLYTSVWQHKQELEREKSRMERWKKELEENKRTFYLDKGTDGKKLFNELIQADHGKAAGFVYRNYMEMDIDQDILNDLNYRLSDKLILKFRKEL